MRSAAAVSLISCGSSINEVLTPRTANGLPWIYDARMPLIWCKWCNNVAWCCLNHATAKTHGFTNSQRPNFHVRIAKTSKRKPHWHIHCSPVRRNLPKLGEKQNGASRIFAIEIESSTRPLFLREKNIREPWPKSSFYVVLCRYAYAYTCTYTKKGREGDKERLRQRNLYIIPMITNEYHA